MIKIDNFEFYNANNMEIMAQYPDKYFDLAIVDPPYGIGHSLLSGEKRGSKFVRTTKHVEWDIIPNKEYFIELFRISKNQIIWGGNYFINELSNTKCFLMWDKVQSFSGSDFELAWTSFDKPSKSFRMSRVEAYSNGKIHPTEKPTDLYDWTLKNYAVKGYKILDTHLGSGSIALAIDKANKLDNMQLSFVGIELDSEYFEAAVKRFKLAHKQQTLIF